MKCVPGIKVAVIIIGRNEGQRLARCLESVRSIEYPAQLLEVVYVDSGSTDESLERAHEFGADIVQLRQGPYTAARARNAGLRRTGAEVVFFLDGDAVVDPTFVRAAITAFNYPRVAVVFGNRIDVASADSIFSRVLRHDRLRPSPSPEYCGDDALIRREALLEIGGYRESLAAGEEPEMCARMRQRGYVILHLDRPMTSHHSDICNWRQYWRRAMRTGHAYAEVSHLLSCTSTPLWEQECKRNTIHAGAYMALALAAVASIAAGVPWIAMAILALFCGLILHTSLGLRRRIPDSHDRLLYAIHAHVQHLPILYGQLTYWRSRLAERRKSLIGHHAPAR